MVRMNQFRGFHVFFIFFLLIFLIEGKYVHAQNITWSQINTGPSGGNIEDLLATPDGTLYASTREFGDIFKSEDEGESWTSIRYNLPEVPQESYWVLNTVLLDSKLYASLPLAGVFCLEEGSTEWVACGNGLPNEEVGVLSVVGNVLYVGMANEGYYASYDGGESWVYKSAGIPLASRYDEPIIAQGDVLYVGIDNHGVYRSVDDGETWQILDDGVPNLDRVDLVFATDNDVYINLESNGLMRLEGDIWQVVENVGLPAQFNATAMYQMGQTLYAAVLHIPGHERGIYRSDDLGANWQLVSMALPDNVHKDFASVDNKLFAALDGAGVFCSDDQGVTWSSANDGLMATSITDVIVFDDVLYASTQYSGIFRSVDDGLTWTIFPETTGHEIGNLIIWNNRLYASDEDILVLEEDGSEWTYLNRVPDNPIESNYIVGLDNVLFASTNELKLLRSEDMGQNWTLIDNNNFSLTMFAQNDTLLVGKFGSGVHKMGIFDAQLTTANVGIETTTAYDFLFEDDRLYMGSNDGLYYTEDLGTSWQILGNNWNYAGDKRRVYSVVLHNGSIYAGAGEGGIHRLNADNNWEAVAEDLPEGLRISTLTSIGNDIFAGSRGRGLYKATVQPEAEVLLSTSTDTLWFGEQPIETHASQTFTVSNEGTQELIISDLSFSGPSDFQFTVVPEELTLQPGESEIVTVTFSPISLADAGPTYLVMTHNGENSPTQVVLLGVGIMQTRLLLDSITGKPGDRIEMPVNVEFATGIAGGDLMIYYNPAILTAVDVVNGPLIDEADMTVIPNVNDEGLIRIAMAGAGIISSSHGTLFTLVFDIREDAYDTTEHLHFEAFVKDMDGVALSSTTNSGFVTVEVDILGDVNDDQLVDSGDAIQVLRHSAGVESLVEPYIAQADVNADQSVDSGDAVLILRKAVGLIETFPGEAATKPILFAGDLPQSDAVTLGNIERDGHRVVIPLMIDSDVMGSDLSIQYDPTQYHNPQLIHNGNSLVATQDHKGQFDVSLVRVDAQAGETFEMTLEALHDQGIDHSPVQVRLSGKVFDENGTALGSLSQLRAGVQEQTLRAYPNPFNPSSTLHYAIPANGNVQLVVYNQMGQVVRTLVSEWQSQGIYQVAWDGRDELGRAVASGLYIGRLQTQSATQEMKLLLLK